MAERLPRWRGKDLRGHLVGTILFMQHAINFTFTFVKPTEVLWGGTCYNAKNCTGIIGMLSRDEADFAIGIRE